MNKKEAAIVSAYTGILIGSFDEAHKYMQEIMGRSLYTHELAFEGIVEEIKKKSRNDFINIKIEDKASGNIKLEEFKFYELKAKGLKGLSVFVGEKEVASGFIVDVLKIIPHLAKYEIESTNTYFDTFVVRLRSD